MNPERRRRREVNALVRKLEPRDRDAVRAIACRTAYRNRGADLLFEDLELNADYWTRYYTDHRPELSWVVEHDGEVVGYFFGCADTRHFVRTMARRIVPSILARALWRLGTGRYAKPESRRYLRFALTRGAKEAPKIDLHAYPAHYHCNILRKGLGRGYYTRMTLMFLDALEARGIEGIHGQITEPAGPSIWNRLGNEHGIDEDYTFVEVPCTMFAAVLGDETPYVNRAWSTSVANYRMWIEWLRATHKV